MFMIFRKKHLIFAVLFAVLCLAVALSAKYSDVESVSDDVNIGEYEALGRSEMVSADVNEQDDYTTALNKRKSDRNDALNMLNDTVNNVSAGGDARQSATDKISQLTDFMLKEATIEDLLKAKGYDKVITYVSDREITANVYTDNLTETDVAKIKDIIVSQTDNNNIKIVAVR